MTRALLVRLRALFEQARAERELDEELELRAACCVLRAACCVNVPPSVILSEGSSRP
jgi:hypothetical protein